MKLIGEQLVLEPSDILNELGFDLTQRETVIGATDPEVHAQAYLKTISQYIYNEFYKRQESERLVTQFNGTQGVAFSVLIEEFKFIQMYGDMLDERTESMLAPSARVIMLNNGLLFSGKFAPESTTL